MKTEFTNRARAELLLALHKLDQFEDSENSGGLLLLSVGSHCQHAERVLDLLEQLTRKQLPRLHKADNELREFAEHLRSQQSQGEDQL